MTHAIGMIVKVTLVGVIDRYRGKSGNMKKIKVLLIEDRFIMRHHIKTLLSDHAKYELLGSCKDIKKCWEHILDSRPDILIVEGSLLLGQQKKSFEKLMYICPMQLIVLGNAVIKNNTRMIPEEIFPWIHSFIEIDESRIEDSMAKIKLTLIQHDVTMVKINAYYEEKVKANHAKFNEPIIAIGASTGGVTAIEKVLMDLSGDTPPILMVQHISKAFTGKMADRLSKVSDRHIKEGEHGEILRKNMVYLAPGDQHMTIKKMDSHYIIVLDDGPKVHFQRPAVDQLFQSLAREVGSYGVGVLLTGMGRDGAKGLLEMKNSGAYTIAQDEKTSVVFGMPKAAIELGASCEIAPIHKIASKMIEVSIATGKQKSYSA